MYKWEGHCRWCGKSYYPKERLDRDGFCCPAHKQAHYRAYKKYVTSRKPAAGKGYRRPVTQKKRKKRKL